MNEPLEQQPFRVLEGARDKLLGRRRVVPAWQSETAAESELRELSKRVVTMPRQPELPGVDVEKEPAEPAERQGIDVAGKKHVRLSAAQIAELRRRSVGEKHGPLMTEFKVSSGTFYKHIKGAKGAKVVAEKKTAGRKLKLPAPAPKEPSELGTEELMGVLEAFARFVDARVDRKLAEAFARLGGK